MRGRDSFEKNKKLIYFFAKLVGVLPYGIKNRILLCVTTWNGKVGILIRYILLKTMSKSCGSNVSVHSNVVLKNIQNIDFGNNVSIHSFCYIDGAGEISIGNDVSIAHSSSILSANHVFSSPEIPIKDQGVSFAKTFVSDNVWVGCGCRILAGSVIKEGGILAAGAVLAGVTVADHIYGGVPAKKIKSRFAS